MKDYYGRDFSYIHLKFGDMRKMYFFTKEFQEEHPNFCKEYQKYWNNDPTCRFKSPLEIAQYVDMFNIPVEFYYNYTDTPSKDITDVYDYFLREYSGIPYEADGSQRADWQKGIDGEEPEEKHYQVIKVEKK